MSQDSCSSSLGRLVFFFTLLVFFAPQLSEVFFVRRGSFQFHRKRFFFHFVVRPGKGARKDRVSPSPEDTHARTLGPSMGARDTDDAMLRVRAS